MRQTDFLMCVIRSRLFVCITMALLAANTEAAEPDLTQDPVWNLLDESIFVPEWGGPDATVKRHSGDFNYSILQEQIFDEKNKKTLRERITFFTKAAGKLAKERKGGDANFFILVTDDNAKAIGTTNRKLFTAFTDFETKELEQEHISQVVDHIIANKRLCYAQHLGVGDHMVKSIVFIQRPLLDKGLEKCMNNSLAVALGLLNFRKVPEVNSGELLDLRSDETLKGALNFLYSDRVDGKENRWRLKEAYIRHLKPIE